MILSMTGFGDAEASFSELHCFLEVRSLNHRYFKATIKLPDFLQSFEPEIEKLLRQKLSRGSINYQLKAKNQAFLQTGQVDSRVLKSYMTQLQAIAAEYATMNTAVDLAGLLNLPGVCLVAEILPQDRDETWKMIARLTEQAIQKLLKMRTEEGQALAADLLDSGRQIRRLAGEILQRAPLVVREYQDRLRSRVNELLADSKWSVQQNDLLREVALFAERCDISEEITRLNSHLDQFDQLCNGSEYAGRKLDFLTQEMLRETNTIGSKASDTIIARHVVEMKGLIDRLKEQVQNVE